ncbi:hypothetical protein AHiyo8_36680 [Arthrobacter sp. Hiyo8]|nr:hypothetical protein AHiyo8_36680 [Arthrobacter sp. Hiyo8]
MLLGIILLATLTARVGQGSDAYLWILTLGTTLVAAFCSVVTALWRLRPAGSLFHIFAFAAIASVPQQPRSGKGCWRRF